MKRTCSGRGPRALPICRHPDTLAVVGGLKCKACGKVGTLAQFKADRKQEFADYAESRRIEESSWSPCNALTN